LVLSHWQHTRLLHSLYKHLSGKRKSSSLDTTWGKPMWHDFNDTIVLHGQEMKDEIQHMRNEVESVNVEATNRLAQAYSTVATLTELAHTLNQQASILREQIETASTTADSLDVENKELEALLEPRSDTEKMSELDKLRNCKQFLTEQKERLKGIVDDFQVIADETDGLAEEHGVPIRLDPKHLLEIILRNTTAADFS